MAHKNYPQEWCVQVVSLLRGTPEQKQLGMEMFYPAYLDWARRYTGIYRSRVWAQDREDFIQSRFITAVSAIERLLQDPESLFAFVWAIFRYSDIHERKEVYDLEPVVEMYKQSIKGSTAKPDTAPVETSETVNLLLSQLSPADREILTRFYLREQPAKEIMHEMRLTETQYRLKKSRALGKAARAADALGVAA